MPNKRFFLLSSVMLLLLSTVAQAYASHKPTVYFGINLRHNPRTMYHRYQPLMDYLTANTPYKFEMRISRDYKEALRDLNAGRAFISSLGDGAFVDAIILQGAVPILKPLNRDGKPFYRCAIIVQRDSGITSLEELKGKRFAFGSYHSVSGSLLPRYMLKRAGTSCKELGSMTSLKNHDAVTKAVLKGQYHAGAVKDVFAAKYQPHGLRVLAFSAPIPSIPLVVRKTAPQEMIDVVTAALLKLDPANPAHLKIMSEWDEEYQYGFARASAADYRELIEKFKSIPLGCAARCHK